MWYNPIILWLLRSPLHGFMSKSTMIISYKGRKSGKTYSTPINYWVMPSGDELMLITTSQRSRSWWRNFRQEAPLELRIRGRDLKGRAIAVEDEAKVAEILGELFRQAPQMGRYYKVGIRKDGQPNAEDIRRAAQERIVVKIYLVDGKIPG